MTLVSREALADIAEDFDEYKQMLIDGVNPKRAGKWFVKKQRDAVLQDIRLHKKDAENRRIAASRARSHDDKKRIAAEAHAAKKADENEKKRKSQK